MLLSTYPMPPGSAPAMTAVGPNPESPIANMGYCLAPKAVIGALDRKA